MRCGSLCKCGGFTAEVVMIAAKCYTIRREKSMRRAQYI